MDTDLSGRVALITGGSHNIGRAISTTLAGAGARVAVLWQSSEEAAKETCRLIGEAGGTAQMVRLDLCDVSTIGPAVDAVEAELGPVDILVNNSAIRPQVPLAEVTPELWDQVFGVNVRGAFFVSQRVIPGMMERRWGRIITMGGLHGYVGSYHRTQVHASKVALIGMSRALAYETAEYGVTSNIVVPGRIATQRGPLELYGEQMDAAEAAQKVLMKRRGRPEDIANLCLFLASDRSSYITGQELFVTGGTFPLVPGL